MNPRSRHHYLSRIVSTLSIWFFFNEIVCIIYRGLLVCFSQGGTGVPCPHSLPQWHHLITSACVACDVRWWCSFICLKLGQLRGDGGYRDPQRFYNGTITIPFLKISSRCYVVQILYNWFFCWWIYSQNYIILEVL